MSDHLEREADALRIEELEARIRELVKVLRAAPGPMDSKYEVGDKINIKLFMYDYGAWSRQREETLAEVKP
jgi:hypothetical protein